MRGRALDGVPQRGRIMKRPPGFYDQSAYGLLCLTAARRLFALRNGPHGAEARAACRLWLRDLRLIRELEKENTHVPQQ